MVWECSECGANLKRRRPPAVCPECGLAGAVFLPADPDEQLDGGALRAGWWQAGFDAQRPRPAPPEARHER